MKTNLKDDMNYRSKRDKEDQINRFEPLSDKNDNSDGFWSKDTTRIENRKEYKKENHQTTKKKAVKNKKKSNKPKMIGI